MIHHKAKDVQQMIHHILQTTSVQFFRNDHARQDLGFLDVDISLIRSPVISKRHHERGNETDVTRMRTIPGY